MSNGETILQGLGFYIARDAVPELVAVEAEWLEAEKHLRLTYYLDGIVGDVDFEPLELGLGEAVADFWSLVKTVGSVYVFDSLLTGAAGKSGRLVYKRGASGAASGA